jgi:hypothetical protein
LIAHDIPRLKSHMKYPNTITSPKLNPVTVNAVVQAKNTCGNVMYKPNKNPVNINMASSHHAEDL